jgi:hypothetical protein
MRYQNMEKVKIWVYIAAIFAILSDAVSKNTKGSARYLSLLAIVGVIALVCGAFPALAATSRQHWVRWGATGSWAIRL